MVAVRLSKIHSLLGKRGRDNGTLSAFELLQNVEVQLEQLKVGVIPAMQLAEGAAAQAMQQKQEIFETLQTACNPLFQFFLKFSSNERSPGDLFDQRFQKIEVELNWLVKRVRTDGGPETAGPNRETFSNLRHHWEETPLD